MSHSVFISHVRADEVVSHLDFTVDIPFFVSQMREKWHNLNIRIIPEEEQKDEGIMLEWEREMPPYRHQGSIQTNTYIIFMNEYPKGVAEFAVWYRSFVTHEQELFLYHTTSIDEFLRLEANTTETEIMRFLGG